MFARLYWILPLFSTCVWLSMLMAMLITWGVDDNEVIYPSESEGQHIPYISDVGAYKLRPLFIAMAATTVVTLDLSLLAERWLRHTGKLAPNTSWVQKILSLLAIFFSIVGAVGIILLTIFDTADYPNLHDVFVGLFIAGYVVSAAFICAEYQRLGKHFRQHASLRISFWLKLAFILLEVALAIAFGVTEYKGRYNASAVLEWTVAFIFTGYIATFIVDLLPAVRVKHAQSHPAVAELQEQRNGYTNGYTNGNAATNY